MIIRYIFIGVDKIVALRGNRSGLEHEVRSVNARIQDRHCDCAIFALRLCFQRIHAHIGCSPGIAGSAGKGGVIGKNIVYIIDLIRIAALFSVLLANGIEGLLCVFLRRKLQNRLVQFRIIIYLRGIVIVGKLHGLHDETLRLKRRGDLVLSVLRLLHRIEGILRESVYVFFEKRVRFRSVLLPRCMLLYCYIFFGAIAGVRRLYHLVKLLRLAVCLHLSGFRVHRDGTEVIFLPGIRDQTGDLLAVREFLPVNGIRRPGGYGHCSQTLKQTAYCQHKAHGGSGQTFSPLCRSVIYFFSHSPVLSQLRLCRNPPLWSSPGREASFKKKSHAETMYLLSLYTRKAARPSSTFCPAFPRPQTQEACNSTVPSS